ncbi:MAG: carboxymuconolactone decarboxylase family protein [Pseudomonadota bacterium]
MIDKETRRDRSMRGEEIMRQLDPNAGAVIDTWLHDLAPDLGRYIREFSFGDIYAREGISLRDREIAAIAALAAKSTATSQLKGHIKAGLHIGLTREEIVEVIMQTVIYSGVPATLNAFAAMRDVLAAEEAAHTTPTAAE